MELFVEQPLALPGSAKYRVVLIPPDLASLDSPCSARNRPTMELEFTVQYSTRLHCSTVLYCSELLYSIVLLCTV